jgi:hypothetical protein
MLTIHGAGVIEEIISTGIAVMIHIGVPGDMALTIMAGTMAGIMDIGMDGTMDTTREIIIGLGTTIIITMEDTTTTYIMVLDTMVPIPPRLEVLFETLG